MTKLFQGFVVESDGDYAILTSSIGSSGNYRANLCGWLAAMGFVRGILKMSIFHALVTSLVLDVPQSLQSNELVIEVQQNIQKSLDFSSNSTSKLSPVTTDSGVLTT